MDYNKNHEGYHYKSHRSHSSDILLVKIMTIRHLNRALHLDNVTIKLCNWKQWEKARPKLTANYDFFEGDPESDEEIDRASKGDEEPDEEEQVDPEPDTDKDAEDDEEEGEAEKGEYEYYDEEKPEEDEYYGADYYDEEKPEETEFKADGAEGGWEYYGEEGEENKEDMEEKKEGEEGEGDYD